MNYYEILEVSQHASKEVIKAAYKSLIQRYHPDKNPDNVEVAERAALVVQAYEVLSDSDMRNAYDLQLQNQLINSASDNPARAAEAQLPGSYVRKRAVSEKKFSWYLWFLIVLIIFSGWVILSLTKKKQSPESELYEIRLSIAGNQLTQEQLQDRLKREAAILKEHPEILKKEARTKENEDAARTIPVFITQLTIHLKIPLEDASKQPDASAKTIVEPGNEKDPGKGDESGKEKEKVREYVDSGHVLSIPSLGLKVGSFDSEKVIRYVDSQQELISQQLYEKLTYASYDDLVKIDGEAYLKKLILDSIGETTGTNRFEDYPSSKTESPGRYGVVDVFFPEDFVAH